MRKYRIIDVQLRDGRWESQVKVGRKIVARFDFFTQAQKWVDEQGDA